MSESTMARVYVRDGDRTCYLADADDWTQTTLLAILSCDPRNWDEFARAWRRYRPDEALESLPWIQGLDAPTGLWMFLDLACQRVTAGNGCELPLASGAYQRDDGDWDRSMPLVWVHYPPYWHVENGVAWDDAIPPLPSPTEPLDFRGILFGRPMAEDLAWRTLEIARNKHLPAVPPLSREELHRRELSEWEREMERAWHDLTVRVHVDWLMTARSDLEGQIPRHFLHQGREWMQQELEHRREQWDNERRQPRGLDRDTLAYRYGPMGTHEVVMYFDYCRALIKHAWQRICQVPDMNAADLASELQQYGQDWLATPQVGERQTPGEIIDLERQRIPLISHDGDLGADSGLNDLLQKMGGAGYAFEWYDGHHLELDDEFAFSLYADLDDWEMMQG